MTVQDLIQELRKLPMGRTVYIDDGKYVDKARSVRMDSRDYVIISAETPDED